MSHHNLESSSNEINNRLASMVDEDDILVNEPSSSPASRMRVVKSADPIRYSVDTLWDPGPTLDGHRQDLRILQVLENVAADPHIKKSFNGQLKDVEAALAKRNLFKEEEPSTCPFSEIAHYIKHTLLDVVNRLDPLPMAQELDNGKSMIVLPRTELSFMLLAEHLECTVFVFSSTAEPHVFRPKSVIGTLVFLHRKNEFRQTSDYIVLHLEQPDSAASSATTIAPLPPAAFLTSSASPAMPACSTSISMPSVPLQKSVHLPDTSSPIAASSSSVPIPTSWSHQSSSSSANEESAPLPFATFRTQARKQIHTPKSTRAHVTTKICEGYYRDACDEFAAKEVGLEVGRLVKKRRKHQPLEDVFSQNKKQDTLLKMKSCGRVPANLNDRAYELISTNCENTDTFHKANPLIRIDNTSRLEEYHNAVTRGFAVAWDTAVQHHRQLIEIEGPPVHRPTLVASSSSSEIAPGGVAQSQESVEELSDHVEPELQAMVEAEAIDREKRRLRTVTVQLDDIVRHQLRPHVNNMKTAMSAKQVTLTNASDELFCLARKTTLLMADGTLQLPCTSMRPQVTHESFDIRRLLPYGFTARCDMSPLVPVSPLPEELQNMVESQAQGPYAEWVKDLQGLLSHHHLGYLYARFLAPRGLQSASDSKHPLWAQLADNIKLPPIDSLGTAFDSTATHPMDGLSIIFGDYRTEMATNLSNLWEGSLYAKCLDFLLRFTLRLNLAPLREQRYYDSVHALSLKKKAKFAQAKDGRKLTRKAWTDRTERLQNDLGRLLRRSAAECIGHRQIPTVLQLLHRQSQCEPPKVEPSDGVLAGPEPDFLASIVDMDVIKAAVDEIDSNEQDEQ
ncbi:hypothetical protein BGX23_002386 [Mortierella sp. AD031]|nr:hypothetical protein BGX23_002386 [Mortierella sp. AD031]